jgi:V/A-type H+-transporting ATPase subunit E
MEIVDSGSKALISGIEEDAGREAEKLLDDARKKAEELARYTQKQVESILKEGEEKAKAQSEAIIRKALSGVEVELRRRSLQFRERLFGEVMTRVKEELSKMIKNAEYRNVLLDWIVEAAVGLEAEEAIVAVSKIEQRLVDAGLLQQAEKQVKKITEKKVRLTAAQESESERQGIILTASDGKTAYNNLVATRLLRKQRQVRDLIYRELFGE